MTLAQQPQVPLPFGAVPTDHGDEWTQWDNEFRVIYGPETTIPDTKIKVHTSAVQRADGSIEARDAETNQPGPSVSVEAHFDEYLTAEQARELAAAVSTAADLVDQWRNDYYSKHDCPFDWCTTVRGHHDERFQHWGVTYTPISKAHADCAPRSGAELRIGLGVKYHESRLPEVILHLDGGDCDYDDDAYLSIDEAVQIRDELNRCIQDAVGGLKHHVESVGRIVGGAK